MPEIDDYGFGRVTIDGRQETRDVIVLPDRVVRGWWRKEGHGLVLADLDEVLDELPRRLLVGTGAYGRLRPDADTLETLRARGVEVEVLPTAEAVRRYAELDPRKTAAALRRVLDGLPDGARALVVGHSPTNEAAVLGLTGEIVAPLAKGAGVLVVAGDDDGYLAELLE